MIAISGVAASQECTDALATIPKMAWELEHPGKVRALAATINPDRVVCSSLNAIAIMTTTAWANPHQLHPWFRMPSQKRKDLSDEDEDAPSPFYERRSISPAPSPKRRRCDVLENGMSQLTLDGRSIAPSAPYILASVTGPPTTTSYPAPIVQYPTDVPSPTSQPAPPSWTDAPYAYAPRVTHIPTNMATAVVLPGSVEEPTSPPETGAEETEVRDVSMKGPSWYEIEKDRTSASSLPSSPSPSARISAVTCTAQSQSHRPSPSTPPSRRALFRHHSRPPCLTVIDEPSNDTGIVITDLEDSDTEDENNPPLPPDGAASRDASAPDRVDKFSISSALLDRLPKPHRDALVLRTLDSEPSPSTALVLYRPPPMVPLDTSKEEDTNASDADVPEAKSRRRTAGEEVLGTNPMEEPMGEEEVPMEDTRPCTPMVLELSVDDSADEPMDIEML